jgi:putative N6-adenine-specific DNA methylase
MDWPNFDEQLWHSIQASLTINDNPFLTILASDRDAGAIKMAQANAERARVAEYIEFKCQAVSAIELPAGQIPRLRSGQGWIVTNPPYGLRISEGKDLRNLYAQFGNVLREKCPGWELSVLCSDQVLLGQMRLELDTSLGLVNGGIRVRLGRGVVR